MKHVELCKLISKKEIIPGIFDFVIESENIAKDTQCGQFLHINCGDGTFLRRPISICDAYDGKVRFIFEVKGQGTKDLSKKETGDMIDIIGPLGHGFEVSDNVKHPVVIGGGIGVFPLYKLTKELGGRADVFLGFRSADRVVMESEFEKISNMTIVGTDDGSYGYDGYIAAAMEQYLNFHDCDMIYSCGPMPMLKAVKKIAEEKGIRCQISLEQRMGCGIGACLVCSCETVNSGADKYAKVCTNGPVFYSGEVTLND